MTTRSAASPTSEPFAGTQAGRALLSPLARGAISALLVLHLAAVFIAPFSFACRVGASSSPFADGLMYCFRPYIDALFLNHGYFFFAPNPGETHLVRYRAQFDDGREPLVATFPDLNEHFPRLLYHRHFMLAEALNNAYVPEQPPPEPSPPPASAASDEHARHQQLKNEYREQLEQWKHRRQQYEALHDSFVSHLKAVHGADRVTLTRVEHRNLFPNEFTEGKKLSDASTYRDLPETYPAASSR